MSETFQYVLIPADNAKAIESRSASTEGGLTDDALLKVAKEYFHELTGAKARAEQLEKASPEERKALARQIREQMKSSRDVSGSLESLDDEAVINVLYKSQVEAPTCDIAALTVPTAGNDYQTVSLYAADNAREHQLPHNKRATELLMACGHQALAGGIYGDAFVGRAIDNEVADVWKRIDFTPEDADPVSEWCRVARSPGGGGGTGKAGASSLSKLAQQQTGQPVQIMDFSSPGTTEFGMEGAPAVQEPWGSWTQTDDEVELRFTVDAGTRARDCNVQFSRNRLSVAVAGKELLNGVTFDPIEKDESTYTLEDDDSSTRRDLFVTLTKVEAGRVWAWAVR
jgi:hypothetical protein